MSRLIAVAFGGACGSVLRYLVGAAFLRAGLTAFPWGTLTVNVLGGLALGFLARYYSPPFVSQATFLALTVGLCGGFTTFSAFTLEMYTMVERGLAGRAVLYAVGSVTLSLVALAMGYGIARGLRPLP